MCVLLAMTGCNLFDRDAGESFNLIAPPTTGNANVKFQIVLPGENASIIKPALRLSGDAGDASVMFRLVLVFPGAEGSLQTTVIQRQVPVAADGSAETMFSGVPETPVIAQVQIEGGNLGGKASFHGALDLAAGDNEVELAPVGSEHPADIAAGVMLDIINIPEIIRAAPANLVSAITSSAQASMNSDLSGAELYGDVLNRFVTSPLLPTFSYLKISLTNDYGLFFENGPLTSQTRTSAELWSGIPGADGLVARRIIRQGFGTKGPLVAFTDLERAKFALAYVTAEGRISKYFISDKNTLSHLSAVQIVSEDDSVIFGAVANGLPVLIRWSGNASAVCGWPISDSSVLWSHNFPYTTADARVAFPTVELLSFDPLARDVLRCFVRNPKSILLQEYKVSTAGVFTPMFSPAAEAMFALTAMPGNRTVVLYWDSIPNAEFYTLYWSLSSEIPRSGDGANVISRVTRPFAHTGLQENQTYHYVITWTANGEESAPSKAASATPIYNQVTQYYRVTYYGNGQTGGLAPVDPVSYLSGDKAEILDAGDSFARTGYQFVGWNTAEDGTGTDYTPGQQIEIETAGLTLYAKWQKPSYSVTYDGNGHTSGQIPTQGTYDAGSQVVVSANTGSLARIGYAFSGWNTAADGSGTSYNPGESLIIAADIKLYAVWQTLTRVTYHGNGHTSGQVPVDSTVYTVGENVTLLANTGSLTREGYTFSGWNTAADGSGAGWTVGSTVAMPAEGLVLYARWRSDTLYQVNFLGNGSDGGEVPSVLSYLEGSTVTVPGNTGGLTNSGKTFMAWNTAADGSGMEYAANSTFIMPAANVNLYAQWQEFAGGDGSSNSPYLIANAAQLNRVRNHLEAYFTQIADIDLSGTVYSNGNGWVPIGSSTLLMKFKGNYDGNGKKIINLYIRSENEEGVGLFGVIDNAVITNLTVENADVTGKNAVGILAGNVSTSTISNCHSSGKVRCVSARSGGLVGYGMSITLQDSSSSASVSGLTFQGGLIADVSVSQTVSSIANCHASGSVIGSYTVGGLIGSINGKNGVAAVVGNSRATGDVSGDNHSIGGLIGSNGGYCEVSGCHAEGNVTALPRNDGYSVTNVGGLIGMNSGQISDSSAIGTVSGGFQVGGLVGHSDESGQISRCYATGSVTTNSDRVGGLVGLNYSDINDSYATGSVSGNNRVGGLLGLFHTGTVNRCYAAGLVTGGNSQPYIGGLCGDADGTVSASYWDTGATAQSTSSGGTPLTTSQMQQQGSFSGWDFSAVWTIKTGDYPTLR